MGEALNTDPRVSRYQTKCLEQDDYLRLWPDIEGELEKVRHTWESAYTKEFLRDIHVHGHLMAWASGPGDDARLIIWGCFITSPVGRGLRINLAIGNDLDGCLDSIEATFEKIANNVDCDFVEIIGRRGWERRLRGKGFEVEAIVLTKRLRNFRVQ